MDSGSCQSCGISHNPCHSVIVINHGRILTFSRRRSLRPLEIIYLQCMLAFTECNELSETTSSWPVFPLISSPEPTLPLYCGTGTWVLGTRLLSCKMVERASEANNAGDKLAQK